MKFKTRNIIVKCAADLFMPLTAMLGIYVVMHGDSSPGGGFQGGVLVAGALLMLFLGYGTKRGRPARLLSRAPRQWLRSFTLS